jgi:hypothetical protein
MDNSWDNYESAPLEFFHGRLIDLFHEFRQSTGQTTQSIMNGSDLNNIIAKAKIETYKKYPKQVSNQAIPKSEI